MRWPSSDRRALTQIQRSAGQPVTLEELPRLRDLAQLSAIRHPERAADDRKQHKGAGSAGIIVPAPKSILRNPLPASSSTDGSAADSDAV